ncbi:polymer-forming cytoskeletal protein [Halomonas denitrificans]|nr:polymer-forming cytoskeletal protein [Halomonas denitrificans]
MGILGRNRPQQGAGTGSTILGSGTELVGDLTLNDSLHVDGRLDGNIRSEADVTIGETGRVDGEIRSRRVLVSGSLNGRIEAERLEIVAGGSVEGTISVVDLVIEPGGRFNGASELREKASESSARDGEAKRESSRSTIGQDSEPDRESSPA